MEGVSQVYSKHLKRVITGCVSYSHSDGMNPHRPQVLHKNPTLYHVQLPFSIPITSPCARAHSAKSALCPRISKNPFRFPCSNHSKPSLRGGPFPFSTAPAQTRQLIGWSSSAPRTRPTHIKRTDTRVSREMSRGSEDIVDGAVLRDAGIVGDTMSEVVVVGREEYSWAE